jgi:hypothetical protein
VDNDRSKRAPRKHTTVRRVEWYLGPDKEIRPEDLDKYEAEGGWMIQPKVDGMWCCLTVANTMQGEVHTLKSRDARTPPIMDDKAGDLPETELFLPEGTILVGELEAASQWATEQAEANGYRKLYCFDIVRLGDEDLRHLTTEERHARLEKALHILTGPAEHRFPIVPYFTNKFRERYDRWIELGFEGCVIKRMDSLYQTHRMDGKTDLWLRCKKHVTGDFVLMGVGTTPGGKTKAPGPIGLWGQYSHGQLKQIMRAHCDPEFYDQKHFGRVAEFTGWERFKSGSLRHAQFVRWRDDKPKEDCVLNGPEDAPGYDPAQATLPDNDLTGDEF